MKNTLSPQEIIDLNERWVNYTLEEQTFAVNFLQNLYPDKKQMLKEARWWNTIGDILGIFDPTGIVDVANGLDYFRQGDNLFAIMSLISAVPLIGDVVGKPVVLALKGGGDVAKALRAAKTSTDFAKVGAKAPVFGKLLTKMETIGPKLMKIVEKIPGGKSFTKMISRWVGETGLLTNAAKTYKYTGRAGGKITANLIKDFEKVSLLKTLKSSVGLGTGGSRAFRDFGKGEWGLLTRIFKKIGWWKNPALTKLLVKTKFWMKFLDFVGVANFVGPEELSKQMGDEDFQAKLQEYSNSPEGKKYWEEEMGGVTDASTNTATTQQPAQTQQTAASNDPFMNAFKSMFA
jgi:hypothetical protein